jgi:hypothetical protein
MKPGVMQSKFLVYHGKRIEGGVRVWVEDPETHQEAELPHVQKHSPTGFEWGYGGSGPADLALAILAYHLEMDGVSSGLYQQFKMAFVQNFGEEWSLRRSVVDKWLTKRWSAMTEDQIQGDLRA